MNFEELQQCWQDQQITQPANTDSLKAQLENNWLKYQRNLKRTNNNLTISLTASSIGIAVVYFAFRHDFGWPFDFSIAATFLLMGVYLGVVWKSYAFKKECLETSSREYINYQLKKLKWQRLAITRYSLVYAVLLWFAMTMYIWEITKPGSALFRYAALATVSAYIAGVNTWYRIKKQKPQLQQIDSLSTELQLMKKALED